MSDSLYMGGDEMNINASIHSSPPSHSSSQAAHCACPQRTPPNTALSVHHRNILERGNGNTSANSKNQQQTSRGVSIVLEASKAVHDNIAGDSPGHQGHPLIPGHRPSTPNNRSKTPEREVSTPTNQKSLFFLSDISFWPKKRLRT